MSEAERLQKIVTAQELEIRKLRKLMAVVRIARLDYGVDEGKLNISCTCIGIDEFHFIEQVKPELMKIAEEILDLKLKDRGAITDAITGEPIKGGVSV